MIKIKNILSKRTDKFLFFLILSLIGNSIADYAMLWYSIEYLNINKEFTSTFISYVYIGQAVGAIFIAPILVSYAEKFKKRTSSILLDLCYVVVLFVSIFVFQAAIISQYTVFILSAIIFSLSMAHKSSVGFSVIKKLSDSEKIENLMPRFIAALNIPYLFGSIISGLVYHALGITGCLIIGIITFIPMFFIYFSVFDDKDIVVGNVNNPFKNTWAGLVALKSDSVLLWMAISVGVLNISSSIFPGIIALSFNQIYPNRPDIASISISLSILAGILLTKKTGQYAENYNVNVNIIYSVLPTVLLLALGIGLKNPYLISFAFLASCVGSSFRNVTTGTLRVVRVDKNNIAKVNSIYTSILFLGQSAGGIIIAPAASGNINLSLYLVIFFFLAASVIAYFNLPKTKLVELKYENSK